MTFQLATYLNEDGTAQKYAWPGGYPVYYLVSDGETLCPACVDSEREQIVEAMKDEDDHSGWRVVGADCNWEDPQMFCAHCNKRIESAYAEDEVEQ